MKSILKFSLLCLFLSVLLVGVCACGDTPEPEPEPEEPAIRLDVIKDGATEFDIVYPKGSTKCQQYANQLANKINELSGLRIRPVDDSKSTAEHAILIGATSHTLSSKLMATLDETSEDLQWCFMADKNDVALYANNSTAWEKLLLTLENDYFSAEGNLAVTSKLNDFHVLTAAEYRAELLAVVQKQRDAEYAKLNVNNAALKAKIAEFTTADFMDANYTSKTYPTASYDMSSDAKTRGYTVSTSPTEGQHPRLLFTAADLPAIRTYLLENEEEYQYVLSKAQNAIDKEGKLGMAHKDAKTDSISNYNSYLAENIQALAFMYQLTGAEYYGYQAILAIKNNLMTFSMPYYYSDQCRYYGYTMYVAACVYDWCYDLMTETDKLQIRLAVEYKLCRGNSVGYYVEGSYVDGEFVPAVDEITGESIIKKASGKAKMEIGFPPSGQGSVHGHGTEYQLLRDYMAAAIAFYDETPSWWTYVGGRYYKEYLTPHNYFYDCGNIYPEGSACYGPWRYQCDCYNAWILKSALGKNPFTDTMATSPYSFLAFTTVGNSAFGTGDGNSVSIGSTTGTGCFLTAFLYGDGVLYANALNLGYTVSPAEKCIALSFMPEAAEDIRQGQSAICYNGGYYQQIITRTAWDRSDAACVLMRGAQKYAGGHTHADSGTFQIYYKGLLSGDDGVYDTWGSNHHQYYHQDTIAHSGLLIYNPTYANSNNGYYSGGQSEPSMSQNNQNWMADTSTDMGSVIGVKIGYYDAAKKQAKFAYYANDITKAYTAYAAADYVGRTMLATYTQDETYPMIMFVFDNINAKNASYQKTFLLQCAKQPVIDQENKTVTVDNGKGKLVLKSLLGTESIEAHGGRDTDDKGAFTSRFWITDAKTHNLNSVGGASSKGNADNVNNWGHADLRMAKTDKRSLLLNVLYVTDSGTTEMLEPELIETEDFVGATALNQTALFYTGEKFYSGTIEFATSGAGTMSYYVGGLAAGDWEVTINSKSVGTFTVTQEERCIAFDGKLGDVKLVHKN